jgi:hypothetical protein
LRAGYPDYSISGTVIRRELIEAELTALIRDAPGERSSEQGAGRASMAGLHWLGRIIA